MSDESTEREEHESRRRDTFTLSREAARAVWKKAEEKTGKRPAEILNDLVGQHLGVGGEEHESRRRDMFTLSREARRAVWEKAEETGKWPAEILNDLVGQHLGVGGAKR